MTPGAFIDVDDLQTTVVSNCLTFRRLLIHVNFLSYFLSTYRS